MSEEKATGSHTNYYLVDINEPKRLAPYKAECEDIIEALGMNFAEGNAFKAIWRSCAARVLGLLKPGAKEDGIYDAEKVEYYGGRMVVLRRRAAGLSSYKPSEAKFAIRNLVVTPAWTYEQARNCADNFTKFNEKLPLDGTFQESLAQLILAVQQCGNRHPLDVASDPRGVLLDKGVSHDNIQGS